MRWAWIPLAAFLAGCGARTDVGVSADAGAGGIPCGDSVCTFPSQLCARCDLPDDDGAFETMCIEIPEEIPDWWGARFPGCERPVGTIRCATDAQCTERGSRCLTEGTDTFCAIP